MFSLKRLLTPAVVAASIFLVAGCSSNQATTQDQIDTQQGYNQQTQPPASQPTQQSQSSYQNVSAAQAKQLIDSDKTLQLIDVREESEYNEGHIAGAKLIPIGEFASRIGEIDKTKPVLVYCLSGPRSAEAAQVLAQSGYTKVYNLTNGVSDWTYGLAK